MNRSKCKIPPSRVKASAVLCLFLSSVTYLPSVVAAKNTISISQEYVTNLGIILGKLTPAKQIPLLTAPAKVVIPPAHEYIVSASQA